MPIEWPEPIRLLKQVNCRVSCGLFGGTWYWLGSFPFPQKTWIGTALSAHNDQPRRVIQIPETLVSCLLNPRWNISNPWLLEGRAPGYYGLLQVKRRGVTIEFYRCPEQIAAVSLWRAAFGAQFWRLRGSPCSTKLTLCLILKLIWNRMLLCGLVFIVRLSKIMHNILLGGKQRDVKR